MTDDHCGPECPFKGCPDCKYQGGWGLDSLAPVENGTGVVGNNGDNCGTTQFDGKGT